jgi:hypothetical protein
MKIDLLKIIFRKEFKMELDKYIKEYIRELRKKEK